ncbi:hypothetical protein GCM10022415_09870 [Knoellia locipacati]|uniref:Sialidase domain-containing protein n=1 Tax=Knoellia locipacati TaxID=882824 RepID=A0A512SYA8_9MICO|nr:hypothetical protein [Knoellia locipacati]GEQ12938.1 hypothetical protein KLO01_09850 [Knoellia locipacati]
MTGQPNPVRDRVAGWLDGSDPRATRRLGWGAVALVGLALVWPSPPSDGSGQGPPVASGDRSSVAVDTTAPRAPACWPESGRASTRPAGLAAVSTGPVEPGEVVESTRWGRAGRNGPWGVAAVADCTVVRLDAVWIEPSGRKQRHRIDGSGPSATGVVANGLDGAFAVYSVSADRAGRLAARLHISTDRGRTWQQREVPPAAEPDVRAGVLPSQWQRWPVLDG